ISKLRTSKNMSARELSLKINKNESYINRLEYRKDFEPSISVISDICEACGITLEQFFYYDIDEYTLDKEIIDNLKNLNINKKQALMTLIK
ncbi:MAG: helix-turn-helix transcriptional regulator, partial [Clostridiales bacterium]|nr:helix-turn-helix transcriptional regulator [Candidatus Apopatousia equi]